MTFTDFSEFSESRQNQKIVWSPETFHISDNRYFPICSGEKIYPLLHMFLGWHQFTVVSHNGYLTGGSNRHALSTTNSNVSVAS